MDVQADDSGAPWRRWAGSLYLQVLLAIVAGAAIGHFFPAFGVGLKPLGDAFIKLVKMLIGPVIFFTVAAGVAGLSRLSDLGRVAWKALAYFLVVSTLALFVGLGVANIVRPGAASPPIDPATLDPGAVADYAHKAQQTTVTGFLLNVIPDTVAGAFVSGDILQVLFFAVPFGIALALIGERGRAARELLDSLGAVFFRLVAIFMRAAPLGAFGAFAFTVGKYGLGELRNLAGLIATFYLTSAMFVIVALGMIAWLNGFSILRLVRYLRAELLLVLGTSSSEAALPSLMEKLEKAGAAKPVVGLVTPLGYSFNLDGTNIYMTLAALFIAQRLGIALSPGEQLLLVSVAMLSSKGAAGVTGAGFITLAATLHVVPSVPVAGMALILGVDRFMSECRALTNFIGNAVAALVVAGWEGELDRERLSHALKGTPGPLAAHASENDPD